MLRAGQTAAQSRAADFEVVALLNGVCLVQQRIDRAGNGLAGVGVQRLVAVDQDAQEPVWAFLLKADIPQAKAHAFDNGTCQGFDRFDGAAAVLLFCHEICSHHKKKADLAAHFPIKSSSNNKNIPHPSTKCNPHTAKKPILRPLGRTYFAQFAF